MEKTKEVYERFLSCATASIVRRYGTSARQDVEDAVQSAWLKGIRRCGSWEGYIQELQLVAMQHRVTDYAVFCRQVRQCLRNIWRRRTGTTGSDGVITAEELSHLRDLSRIPTERYPLPGLLDLRHTIEAIEQQTQAKPQLACVLKAALAGYTTDEIARYLSCTSRHVRRLRQEAAELLRKELQS